MNVINFIPAVLLMFEGEARFGIYSISKGLTPIGWLAVIFFILALIFGIVFLLTKFLKKNK